MDHDQPDWDSPLTFDSTPNTIMNTLFATAEEVHCGWDTCVNPALVLAETTAVDSRTGSHCRLLEQEYSYDDQPDIMWRDWTVELRSGEVYLLAHWRVQANEAPAIWNWASNEAETAFIAACTLIGQRVRKTLVVESSGPTSPVPPRSHHH